MLANGKTILITLSINDIEKREKAPIKKKTSNNINVIMKNQNLNRTPNPMVVAGIRIEDKIAQLMLDGLNIRLYPISKEGDGIIGIMIYTKRGVSLSNMVVSDELLPAFSRMNKKEKNQLFLLMGMIMMSDYTTTSARCSRLRTTTCSKQRTDSTRRRDTGGGSEMELTLTEAMGVFCSLVIILMILTDRAGTLRKRGTGMIPLMISMTAFCILSTVIDIAFDPDTSIGDTHLLIYAILHIVAYFLTGVFLVGFYIEQTDNGWDVRKWWLGFVAGMIVLASFFMIPFEPTMILILALVLDVLMVLPFVVVGLDSASKAHGADTYFERRTYLMLVLFTIPIILSFV